MKTIWYYIISFEKKEDLKKYINVFKPESENGKIFATRKERDAEAKRIKSIFKNGYKISLESASIQPEVFEQMFPSEK